MGGFFDPAQRVRRPRMAAQRAQHRDDDGRPGDAGQRAEQEGGRPACARDPVGGSSEQDHCDGRVMGDDATDRLADLVQVAQPQRQAAFEQAQRHRERRGREEQFAERVMGSDPCVTGCCSGSLGR
ncbi:MAG TPA: hypothetical protein VF265_07935 [Nevskiaceae bacterium]